MNRDEFLGVIEWALDQLETDGEMDEEWLDLDLDRLDDLPPTDEEISMNLSGTPDFHLRAPGQFKAIKHLYDPRREPFTAATFHTYGAIKADNRPWKPVEIVTAEYPDGVLVRKANRQHGASEAYWERMGYVIDDAGKWWKKV